jgi:hypothetical protein
VVSGAAGVTAAESTGPVVVVVVGAATLGAATDPVGATLPAVVEVVASGSAMTGWTLVTFDAGCGVDPVPAPTASQAAAVTTTKTPMP